MTRPTGSNADEWHLFLTEHLDNRAGNDGLTYMAVQIAEAIDDARAEHRTKCIEAMVDARLKFYKNTVGLELPTDEEALRLYMEMERKLMAASFDAIAAYLPRTA